jgi:ubiquinone/menaquinone biosynthesis C-methylase UbiE
MGIDFFNKNYYERSNTVKAYKKQTSLLPEEHFILEKFKTLIFGKSVLDIGCGGGRTTKALNALTKDYTGIDYSTNMIEACREKYKAIKFVHCDASNMSIFNDKKYDFVLFSFNGIDCMSHGKRLKALKEIYRVLKNDGVLAFSTHNLDYNRNVTAYDIYDVNILRNIRNLCSYFKVRKSQQRNEKFAILSDPLAGFGHLSYYIKKSYQIKVLRDFGFRDIEILNRKCQIISTNSKERDSNFFYYTCKK